MAAAAAAAACRRALNLGTGYSGARFLCSNGLQSRPISEIAKSDGRRAVLFDTLALVRRLERRGLPPNHAEAMTELMTDLLNDGMENVLESFVSKGEMQKLELQQETNVCNFKTEVKSSQDHHFSLLQHETEKLKHDIEKMRSELRYEIDIVTTGLRMDQNLERGRIREELNNQSQETNNLSAKLDREIQTLRAQQEAAKSKMLMYCVGMVASASVVGLGIFHLACGE